MELVEESPRHPEPAPRKGVIAYSRTMREIAPPSWRNPPSLQPSDKPTKSALRHYSAYDKKISDQRELHLRSNDSLQSATTYRKP